MKLLLSVLFLSISAITLGQPFRTTTLELSLGDCRTNDQFPLIRDTIYLYKLPERSVQKILANRYQRFPIELSGMRLSKYEIKFKNSFGQQIIKSFELTDTEINEISLCPDELLEYPQNTLGMLHDKDTIIIDFSSLGCFHSEAKKLTITKECEDLVARLYKSSWSLTKDSMRLRELRLINTIRLTDKHIRDFIRFENELNYVEDGGCTTTDWYTVKSKYLNIERTDGGCRWNGFYVLCRSLFGSNY